MTSFRELSLDRERLAQGLRVDALDMFGKKTEHWFQVRSAYADEVLQALDVAEQTKAINPDITTAELKLEARISLIIDWSFDDDVNDENVREMLKDQPWNADRIDSQAGELKRFFSKPVASSLNGQSKKSPSKKVPTKTEGLSATT